MSFRHGITDSARNASVRNGVAPVQPRAARRFVAGAASLDHFGQRVRPTSSPATASGQLGDDLRRRRRRRCRHRSPRDAVDREGHVARRSSPTTTMLWASCATEEAQRAPFQADPAHEAETDRGRLRGAARSTAILARSRDGSATARPASTTGSRPATRSRSDPSIEPDHARIPAVPRNREIRRGRSARSAPSAAPSPERPTARDLADRPAALQDEVGYEALQVGQHEQICLIAGSHRPVPIEPVPLAPRSARRMIRASSAGTPLPLPRAPSR